MFNDPMGEFGGGANELFGSLCKVEQQREDTKAKSDLYKIFKPSEIPELIQIYPGSYGPNKDKVFQHYRAYAPAL